MSKVVCHISTVHFAFDDRIFYKECISLAKAGYKVFLIVQHSKSETVNNINILALPKFSGRLARLIKGSIKAFKLAKTTKANIFHFHDPELMFMGVFLKLSGRKVIYDVHENVSRQIASKEWINPPFLRKTIAFFYKIAEKFCCLFFDKIVTVIPEIAEEFSTQKSVVIKNLPILGLINPIEREPSDKVKIVYAGGLTRNRGLKEVILAIEAIETPIEFLIMGQWAEKDYYNECKIHKGWGKVNYIGHVNLDEVFEKLVSCDIGVALLYPDENYLRSLPVKAFEYLACGLPIIMSDFPYWKQTFVSGALFTNPKNIQQITESLNLLINNPDIRSKMANEGRKLVIEKYSWEAESEKLINLYNELSAH